MLRKMRENTHISKNIIFTSYSSWPRKMSLYQCTISIFSILVFFFRRKSICWWYVQDFGLTKLNKHPQIMTRNNIPWWWAVEINLKDIPTQFVSALLCFSNHKASGLWRIITSITREESKPSLPSALLSWSGIHHLFRSSRWWATSFQAWNYWLNYKPLSLSFFHFPLWLLFFCNVLACFWWNSNGEGSGSWPCAGTTSFPLSLSRGNVPEINGWGRIGGERFINRWTRRKRDR